MLAPTFEPVTVGLAFLLLGERMSPAQVVRAGVPLAAIAGLQWVQSVD